MNLIQNRYAEQYKQLGQDIGGAVEGAYKGAVQGYETVQKVQQNRLKLAQDEMTLAKQVAEFKKIEKDKKLFAKYRQDAIADVQTKYGNLPKNELDRIVSRLADKEDLKSFAVPYGNLYKLNELKQKYAEAKVPWNYDIAYMLDIEGATDILEKNLTQKKAEAAEASATSKLAPVAQGSQTPGQAALGMSGPEYKAAEGRLGAAQAGAREARLSTPKPPSAPRQAAVGAGVSFAQQRADTSFDNASKRNINPQNKVDHLVEAELWKEVADKRPQNKDVAQELFREIASGKAEELKKTVVAKEIMNELAGETDDLDEVKKKVEKYGKVISVDDFYRMINKPKPEGGLLKRAAKTALKYVTSPKGNQGSTQTTPTKDSLGLFQ